MGLFESRLEIYLNHYKTIFAGNKSYLNDRNLARQDITTKYLDHVKSCYARGVLSSHILGIMDLYNDGDCGYLFTDTELYCQESCGDRIVISYNDIQRVNGHNVTLNNGSVVSICKETNPEKFHDFLIELIAAGNWEDVNSSNENSTFYNIFPTIRAYRDSKSGAEIGGVGCAGFKQVNTSYDEERFHAQQGHGFAAERANDLYDKFAGHKSDLLGDNNVKNGPDRRVDGTFIQSKYCSSGRRCVEECFDGHGRFRYMTGDGPMQIEVPSDKYDQAVAAMERKIQEGKIPGVSDTNEAKNIVRKGHFTYRQAKNIAKAGTVESLTYDAVNGAIVGASALGISSVLTFAVSIWNGDDFETAVEKSVIEGLQVFGKTFFTSIMVGQLNKAGINSLLVGSSESIVRLLGPKASAWIVNVFRPAGSQVFGAAAMSHAAKLLRGNAVTAGVTTMVLSTGDLIDIFRGRISGGQLFKNLAGNAATVTAGIGGWGAGGSAGAALGTFLFPGVGTVVGGWLGAIAGSVLAGSAAGKATNAAVGLFVEDDADALVRVIEREFQAIAEDYLLTKEEANTVSEDLSDVLTGETLKEMFTRAFQKDYAYSLLLPIVEKVVSKRAHIKLPSKMQINHGLRAVIEKLADEDM